MILTKFLRSMPLEINPDTIPSDVREAAQAFNNSLAKRALDLIITIPGLIVISPILLLIAILIKLDSPGPALFKQKRTGMHGRIFYMYKFRTMRHNIDQSLHQEHIRAYKENKLDQTKGMKLQDDPRVTRLGKFLRKNSIDELPQLFNVVIGEMSLVGPRPVPTYEFDLYDVWHSERVSTLPGITGLWQVSGRSRVSFDDQLRMDIRYVRSQSLWLNIKILFYTLPAVISKRGAG